MLIVLNNKCHFETDNFKLYIKELSKIRVRHELVLCPSLIHIKGLKLKRISLGSQTVSSYSNGSYTGEVSAKQLKDVGVKYSIVGHSERRKYMHEDIKDIRNKLEQLLNNSITPILCVGELNKDSTSNIKKSLKKEISNLLEGFDEKKVIIAYEPQWLIGKDGGFDENEVATIKEVLTYIKSSFPNSKVIYGASINEDTVEDLLKDDLVDGFLLGTLSLYPDRLKKMLKKIK